MLPQLVGIAVFAAVVTWTQDLGEETAEADTHKGDNQSPPRAYPSSDQLPRKDPHFTESPLDPDAIKEKRAEPEPPVDPVDAVKALSDDLCRQLMACPDIAQQRTWNDCIEAVQEDRFLAAAFGISPALTLREVVEGNGMGYSAGSISLEQCAAGIRNFSCDQFEQSNSAEDVNTPENELSENNAEVETRKSLLDDIRLPLGTRETARCESIFRPEPVSCDMADSSVQLSSPGIQRLLSALCSEVATCNPGLACETCFEGALATHRFADRIGLNRLSLEAIDYGMGVGLYHFNEENLAQCLEDLKQHSCFRTAGIWDSEAPKDVGRIEQVIPEDSESCAKLFEKPNYSCSSGTADPITQFAESLCGTVVTCRPEIPCDHCIDEVLKSDLIAVKLGAEKNLSDRAIGKTSGENSGLEGLRRAIQQGTIKLDETALLQCANDIDEQTCIEIQLGRGDYRPKGYRSLARGIIRLFQGGTGSCQMVLTDSSANSLKR